LPIHKAGGWKIWQRLATGQRELSALLVISPARAPSARFAFLAVTQSTLEPAAAWQ